MKVDPMDDYARRLAAMAAPPQAYAEPTRPASPAPPAPAPAPAPAPPTPSAPPAAKQQPKRTLRTVVHADTLLSLVTGRPATPSTSVEGGVTVVSVPATERAKPPEPVFSDFDLEQARTYPTDDLLSKSAHTLLEKFKHGLPMAIRYSHLPEVLALYGVDEQIMDAALRHPDRVEIRPESFDKDKRYPVLSFRRGDMLVILGLREPIRPKVIAAYASGLLMHDTHRVDYAGGGGAKRGEKGLPTNTKASVKALQIRGAKVDVDLRKTTAPVVYEGQDIGSIRIGVHVLKADVQSDYQRCLRRIHAIDRREGRTA